MAVAARLGLSGRRGLHHTLLTAMCWVDFTHTLNLAERRHWQRRGSRKRSIVCRIRGDQWTLCLLASSFIASLVYFLWFCSVLIDCTQRKRLRSSQDRGHSQAIEPRGHVLAPSAIQDWKIYHSLFLFITHPNTHKHIHKHTHTHTLSLSLSVCVSLYLSLSLSLSFSIYQEFYYKI